MQGSSICLASYYVFFDPRPMSFQCDIQLILRDFQCVQGLLPPHQIVLSFWLPPHCRTNFPSSFSSVVILLPNFYIAHSFYTLNHFRAFFSAPTKMSTLLPHILLIHRFQIFFLRPKPHMLFKYFISNTSMILFPDEFNTHVSKS